MSRAIVGPALLALGVILTACSAGRPAPEIALINDRGAAWQLSGQRGKVVLLTFGFTHCADTCPAILGNLARLTASLGRRSQSVEIAFVSVDPSRDTPPVLHRFLRQFAVPGGGAIVGLTGTSAQIVRTEGDYHVWSSHLAERHGAYDVAHSAAIFFIDAGGRLRAVHDDDDSQRVLLRAVRDIMG